MLTPGEAQVFWDFYAKSAAALFRRAFVLCNGHRPNAEDAHQETYLKIMDAWARVSPLEDRARMGYLTTTLLNVMRERWRRTNVVWPLEGVDAVANLPDMADHMMTKELYQEVCRRLATLPPQQALVMTLFAFEGLTFNEIAEELRLSPITVRGHMAQARRVLRPQGGVGEA